MNFLLFNVVMSLSGVLPGWLSRYHVGNAQKSLRLFFDLAKSSPKPGHYTQVLKGMLRVYFEPMIEQVSSDTHHKKVLPYTMIYSFPM